MDGIDRFYGILRNPWKPVMGRGPGAVFVNLVVKPDKKLKEDVAKP
ncbi:unnamed protein product [Musa acuminata subsp. malaccensis]|uniref:(wild Malaysian banana) hypothetical protein n=1 Tax=Musa acuminata subsp. malaccensis TaxID=214687 RepID=A0A804KIB3_MUSAM|nr:unnamed protein product [Musa acuminata subsp. malaccensis]